MESKPATISTLLASLREMKEYKGLSDYYIKKSIQQKHHLKTVKKGDLEKELHDLITLKPLDMQLTLPTDILYNTLLQADIHTITNLCTTNKALAKVCSQKKFWETIFARDHLTIYGEPESIDEYVKAYIFDSHATTIERPRGTNFVEWLLKELKNHKIKYQNIDTQSDFYMIKIGNHTFNIDWKHLDSDEIEAVGSIILKYGYTIAYIIVPTGYRVAFVKI